MGLSADQEKVVSGAKGKAHIEVQMRGFALTRGDGMDVEIENLRALDSDGVDSRLLPRLPQRHRQDVGMAVRVATELEPTVELAMMREQDAPARVVHQPSRARDMALGTRALKACGLPAHEIGEPPRLGGISSIDRTVAFEERKERRAVGHRLRP